MVRLQGVFRRRQSGRQAGRVLAAAVAATALLLSPEIGTAGASAQPAVQSPPEPGPWRFPVGERAVYDVTFGPARIGQGELKVEAIDTLAAEPAYRVAFEIAGGPFFYKVDDRTVSWIAPQPFRSLRFEQRLQEGDFRRHRRYTFDHQALTYAQEDWDREAGGYRAEPQRQDVPIPEQALDEIAYLYLVRSLPLEVGRTYTFNRYFKEDGNPVVLQVLRRETVRVPAGRFETVVVRPIIQTDGIFSEGGRAEVYLTDDERRVIVQLRTRMKIGEMNMYLKDYDPGRGGDLMPTPGEVATSEPE